MFNTKTNTQGRNQSVKMMDISNTEKLTAKDRARIKIVEYWSIPDNGFIPWQRLCIEVFHYKNSRYLYCLFTPEERKIIEQEALAERRKNYVPHIAAVDFALLKKAMSGDVAAIKLCYQRFEGWSEKQLHDCLDDAVLQKMALLIFNVTKMKEFLTNDEYARRSIEQLRAELGPLERE
jgi:hypothetical protein